MTNIYRPVYKNLENEFEKLTYDIHIDDKQLDVYGSKIIDLVLRSASEIESISKDLYRANGGSKNNPKDIIFDSDAIALLHSLWNIKHKVVILSHYNCFLSKRIIKPLTQMKRKWNANYQKLKHDRGNNNTSGNLKTLINILAALYLLNVYYKDTKFDLGKDGNGTDFDTSLGSSVFQIKFHKNTNITPDGSYTKQRDFDQCVYIGKMTDESLKLVTNAVQEVTKDVQNKRLEEGLSQDELENLISDYLAKYSGKLNKEVIEDIENMIKNIRSDKLGKIYQQVVPRYSAPFINSKYEAVLNRYPTRLY